MVNRAADDASATGSGPNAEPSRTPATPRQSSLAAPRYRLAARPDAELFSPPPVERLLPSRSTGVSAADWYFVGVCGGAGTTTAARLADAALEERVTDAGQAWPAGAGAATVVLVAPSHMSGLACARDAARQFLSGRAPRGTMLVGLLVVPDRPGRLPPALASAQRLLEGAFPNVWSAPYVPDYRLVADPASGGVPTDRAYLRLLNRISAAARQKPLPGAAFAHASRTAAALLAQPIVEGASR